MRRNRDHASTIRGQLTRIVLIPSLCFLALWLVVAAVGTVQSVQLMGDVGRAAEGTEIFSRAATELRNERRDTLVHLGRTENEDAGARPGPDLSEQRESTDAAVAEAVALAERLRDARDDEVERSAAAIAAAPDALAETRGLVDDLDLEREEALLRFGDLIGGAQSAITALVHTTDGGENLTDAVLTRELMGAHADYATADALLAGVIASGEMSYEETAHFTYLTASYRSTLSTVAPTLNPSLQRRHESLTGRESWRRAEDLSRRVVTRTPIVERDPEEGSPPVGEPDAQWNTRVGVEAAEWDESSASSALNLDTLALSQAERTVDLARSAALLRVALGVAAAVATLVGGVVAIAVVGRSSRRLTDRLVRLRSQILDRDDDLPDIVERAQRGQKVDVLEELPPLDDIGRDEIGQVAEAFDSAQLTAVEAAVRQAEIRRGANRAYLGIAFRNQNLVQRQLRLLDEIEYNEQDPEALRRLFRLDHLATRARRYADNLIILGGGQSVRRWRQPRPLVDVLRAAIAETEDFDRVRLTSAPRVLMHGQAVADVVHLLAELVENATQFSPAGAPVDVSCAPVVGGLTVEVEDRGLGMSEHGYAAAERTLTQPPEFDVMELPEDPRLGLFVVARLAERHGIRVWLRPSSYGGTRATALLPESLLEPVESPVPVPAAAPGGGHEPTSGRARPQPTATGPQTPVAHEGADPRSGPQRPLHGAPAVTGPQPQVGRGGTPAGGVPVDRPGGGPSGPQWPVSVTGPQQGVGGGGESAPPAPAHAVRPGGTPPDASASGPQRPVEAGRGPAPGPEHVDRGGGPPRAPETGPPWTVVPGPDGPGAPGDPGRPFWPGEGPAPARPWGSEGDPASNGPGHTPGQSELQALVALSRPQMSTRRGPRLPERAGHAAPAADDPPPVTVSGPQVPVAHHRHAGPEPRGAAPPPVPPYQVPDPATGPRAPLPKRVPPMSAPPTGAQPAVAPHGFTDPGRPHETQASRPTPPDGFGRVLAPDTPQEARDER